MTRGAGGRGALAELVALHALGWLVLGGAVGLWMATLLLVPEANRFLAPLGYGRWAALHLDLTLYGWLALPIVGALFGYFEVERQGGGEVALGAWSGALVAGSVSWLAGRTSGKQFLDWTGPAALLFLAAQLLLLGVLARAFWRRERSPAGAGKVAGRGELVAAGFLMLALAAVPASLAFAESPGSYPPINPESGGPTGPSLLGSTLGLVAILLLVPRLARVPRRPGGPGQVLTLTLAAHFLFFLAIAGGDHSHLEAGQLIELGSAALWAALIPWDYSYFRWPAGAARWLAATAAWGAALLVTGLWQFLPSVLPRAKFTHELVAHAHLAMAGLASSFALLVLHLGLAGTRRAGLLGGRGGFWLWQGATAAMVAALGGLGAVEMADPAAFLRAGAEIESLLVLRWCAGLAMLAQALRWWLALAGGEPRDA
ncbi:MAG TPA: hypothetical protein VLA66_14220 [Thermoanaerobaculia bacterium]|nr:hypothetical protein [Thermoanaerobaculia bacterium]